MNRLLHWGAVLMLVFYSVAASASTSTLTPTPTFTPTDTLGPNETPTDSPTPYSGSPTPTPTDTLGQEGTPTDSPTPYSGSPTPTPSETLTAGPYESPSDSPTPYGGSPTPTPSETLTAGPYESPSDSPTPYGGSPTTTPTITDTLTPSPVAVATMAMTPGGSSPVSVSAGFSAGGCGGEQVVAAVAADAFSVPVTVTLQVYATDPAPAPGAGEFTVLGDAFQITATDADGDVLEPSASSSETLVFPYCPTALAAAGETPSELDVSYFNGATWTQLSGTVNTGNDTITVVTNHFSVWAVAVKAPPPGEGGAVSGIGRTAFGPVPAKVGQPLTLYFDKTPASGSYQVYNAAGQRVADAGFDTSASLETNALAPGVYWVRISVAYRDGSARTTVQKIVIVK